MDDDGVSTVVGVILLVGIVAVIGVLAAVFIQPPASEERNMIAGRATVMDGDTWLTNHGPDDIPTKDATVMIGQGDDIRSYPLSDLSAPFSDPSVWKVGEKICINGERAECADMRLGDLTTNIIIDNQLVLEVKSSSSTAFQINGGAIQVACPQRWEVHVVGVEITQGEGGPDIPVYLRTSTDGGDSYESRFDGNNVSAGMKYEFGLLQSGDAIGSWGIADASPSFFSEYRSTDDDPHVLTLVDGDPVPIHQGYGGQIPIGDILGPYEKDGKIDIGSHEIMILFEFTSDLSSSAADFQDLVLIYRGQRAAC